MTEFKVGDRVRATRSLPGTGVTMGDLATVTAISDGDGYVKMDNPRKRASIDGRSDGAHWGFGKHSNWLELVDPSPIEKMIPASKVREIAKLYAERHGWCGVVDDALREMGAQDDTFVDVTVVQTRTVRMRRSDVAKLRSEEELGKLNDDRTRIRFLFSKSDIPANASLQAFSFDIGEPVEVKPEAGWVDCVEKPADNSRVRVRPGVTARSLYSDPVDPETEGEVTNHDTGTAGRVLVYLDDLDRSLQLRYEDLQVRQS